MKQFKYVWKLVFAICAVIGLWTLMMLGKPEQIKPSDDQKNAGIALRPPAFVKSAKAAPLADVDFGFLLEEAGFTAYTKLDQPIDLESLTGHFKTVRQQTDDVLSGIITLPGYEQLVELDEKTEVQLFFHKDGWIIAYLTKWQPASALIDWVAYDEKRLTTTTLENVVRSFALDLGGTDINVSYYDFRHPEATNLLLAADRADANTKSDSFEITVPRGLTVYEASWSHAKYNRGYYDEDSECSLNDQILSKLDPNDDNQWAIEMKEFSQSLFPLGSANILSIWMNWLMHGQNSRIYCGVAIVYREAR